MTILIRYVRDVFSPGFVRPIPDYFALLNFRLQKYRKEKQSYE